MDSQSKAIILEGLRAPHHLSDLQSSLRLFCETMQFKWFIYAVQLPVSVAKPYIFSINGYPEGWIEFYQDNNGLAIDPVIQHISKASEPVFWHDISVSGPEALKFMDEAKRFGLKKGLSISARGAKGDLAVLSLATDELDDNQRAVRDELTMAMQWYMPRLHSGVHKLILDRLSPTMDVDLTRREQSCLRWAGDGKTSMETAKLLNISERTVVFHLKNAAKKLQAKNRIEAYAKAVRYGMLNGFVSSEEDVQLVEDVE